jgi:hypothetical protein
MDCYWWLNQIGILLEVVGALTVVGAAFRTRTKIKDLQDSWGGELPVRLRDVIANQAYTELGGFGLLAIGLLMQFAGGFGSMASG